MKHFKTQGLKDVKVFADISASLLQNALFDWLIDDLLIYILIDWLIYWLIDWILRRIVNISATQRQYYLETKQTLRNQTMITDTINIYSYFNWNLSRWIYLCMSSAQREFLHFQCPPQWHRKVSWDPSPK